MHNALSERRRRLFAGAAAAALTAALIPAIAQATHGDVSLSGSNFEIDSDANIKVDHTTPPSLDWANVTEIRKPDLDSGTGDDSFGQGAKEDTAVPAVVDGSIPPNKSDLKFFGVYQEGSSSSGFLNLYWSRVQEPQGTTNMDFEFNQSATVSSNDVTPVRTVGDLLITYDLAQGGTTAVLGKRTWTGTAWGAYTPFGTDAAGTINTSPILAADADGLGLHSERTFGEASIRMSSIIPSGTCTSFGSAYLKSRSSDSFTAALKDFIAPVPVNITNCGRVNIVKTDDANNALNGAIFTLYTDNAPVGGTRGVEDTITTLTCTTSGSGADAGKCSILNVPFGNYWAVETTTPAGYSTAADQQVAVSSGTSTVTLTFIDVRLYKMIVVTCNTANETLVDATVTLTNTPGADSRETIKASELPAGVSEAALCGLAGANYDDLPAGTYAPSVELPDVSPFFPAVP